VSRRRSPSNQSEHAVAARRVAAVDLKQERAIVRGQLVTELALEAAYV
jgi:hypothetical protein